MNRLVYDCCEGLLIGIDSSLPFIHKIMEFSRANVAESSSFLMYAYQVSASVSACESTNQLTTDIFKTSVLMWLNEI